MTDYNELSTEQQQYIDHIAGSYGVSVANLDLDQVLATMPERPKTDFDRLREGWQKTMQQRRARELQAEQERDPTEGLPTEAEAKELAALYGVDASNMLTKEQAQAQLDKEKQAAKQADETRRLKEAIKEGNIVALVDFGESDNPEHRAAARAKVAEILPSFDSWRD